MRNFASLVLYVPVVAFPVNLVTKSSLYRDTNLPYGRRDRNLPPPLGVPHFFLEGSEGVTTVPREERIPGMVRHTRDAGSDLRLRLAGPPT